MERNFEYLGFRGRTCDIVRIGIDWFDYRDDETDLPKVGAFCRKCAKETAKPMMPIYMASQLMLYIVINVVVNTQCINQCLSRGMLDMIRLQVVM